MQLYRELLMDHYRNPRNKASLKVVDFASASHNPSCGDSIFMEGAIREGRLSEIRFDGVGCVISQATASLITEAVKGLSIADISKLEDDFITKLLPISLGLVRFKCARLPLQALQDGINQYQYAGKKRVDHAQSVKAAQRDGARIE